MGFTKLKNPPNDEADSLNYVKWLKIIADKSASVSHGCFSPWDCLQV